MASGAEDAGFGGRLDFIERSLVPQGRGFLLERHVPTSFREPYHHHTSVEVNYLQGAEMTYSFSGRAVTIPAGRLALFWAAAPHRVIEVRGQGQITNLYLSLGQVLRWSLPARLIGDLFGGAVIAAANATGDDHAWLTRLLSERDRAGPGWNGLHLAEIEVRLQRLALEGWDRLLAPRDARREVVMKGRSMRHVEGMLRFIADNYTRPVAVADVAAAVNLSQGHAMALFRDVMHATIAEHLTWTRLSHAQMLLAETDAKVVTVAMDSGFGSLSNFYDAFRARVGVSPARYRRTMFRHEPARPPLD